MRCVFLVAALLVLGAKAGADTISDQVINNLRAQGFEVVQMDRTWLGRMWILARNDTTQREVVFNPATGEILRDYAVLLATLNRPDDNGSDGPLPIIPQIDPVDPVSEDEQPPLLSSGAPLLGGGSPSGGDPEQVEAPVEPNNPVE